jgi:hypothetical protein
MKLVRETARDRISLFRFDPPTPEGWSGAPVLLFPGNQISELNMSKYSEYYSTSILGGLA